MVYVVSHLNIYGYSNLSLYSITAGSPAVPNCTTVPTSVPPFLCWLTGVINILVLWCWVVVVGDMVHYPPLWMHQKVTSRFVYSRLVYSRFVYGIN